MRRRSFVKSLREDNASHEDARVQQQPESSSTRHFPRCPPVPLFSKCSLAAWGDVNSFNKFKSSIPCRSCMDRFELNVQARLERFHHHFWRGSNTLLGQECAKKQREPFFVPRRRVQLVTTPTPPGRLWAPITLLIEVIRVSFCHSDPVLRLICRRSSASCPDTYSVIGQPSSPPDGAFCPIARSERRRGGHRQVGLEDGGNQA
jgi:hypothetical protein